MKFNLQKHNIRLRDLSSRCLVVLATLMSASIVLAEEKSDEKTNYFVVTENDNTQILFPVLDKPVITLIETTVNINSESKSYSAETTDIIDFSFIGDSLNEVTSISECNKGIEYYGNSIIIKGLSKGETVSLFDLNGVTISKYLSNEKDMVIDLNQIPTGIYILSTKNANYKIKK